MCVCVNVNTTGRDNRVLLYARSCGRPCLSRRLDV